MTDASNVYHCFNVARAEAEKLDQVRYALFELEDCIVDHEVSRKEDENSDLYKEYLEMLVHLTDSLVMLQSFALTCKLKHREM